MDGRTAQYRFNLLEFWKSEFYAYNHGMNGAEFFQWCANKDTMNEFISIYFDWVMNDFSEETKPYLTGRTGTLKWAGGEQ